MEEWGEGERKGEGRRDRKIAGRSHSASPFSMPRRLRWSRVVALFSVMIMGGVLYSRVRWPADGVEVEEEIDDVSGLESVEFHRVLKIVLVQA